MKRSGKIFFIFLFIFSLSFGTKEIKSQPESSSNSVKLKSIKIIGSTLFSSEEIVSALGLKIGDLISKERLEPNLKKVEELYSQFGFIGGVIAYNIYTDGVLEINIAEGKIEEIKVVGCEYLDAEDILLNMISKAGEILNINRLKDDLKRVYKLGYFKDVKYKIEPGSSEDKFIVIVEVKEIWAKNISGIEVKGNKKVKTNTLLSLISLKIGDPLSKERLQKEVETLYATGFFYEVKPDLVAEKRGTKVVFIVSENPQISNIKIKGNTVFKEEELKSKILTKEGDILNFKLLSEDRKRIEEFYWKSGYILTRIYDNEIENIQGKDNTLIITIGEGWVEDIKIQGEKEEEVVSPDGTKEKAIIEAKLYTKKYVIRREMETKVGEVLNVNKIKRDLQRIYNLGYFEDVSWKPEEGTKLDSIIVVVKVREGPPRGTAMFGAGYSSQLGFSGSISVSKDNLFGRGRRASASCQFGGITSYELSYFEPWADKKHTSLGTTIFNTTIRREERAITQTVKYDEKRKGFSLSIGRPLRRDVRVSFGFENKEIEFTNLSGEVLTSELSGLTRSINLGITKDTRDNIFNATSGVRDSIMVKFSGGFLGGDFNFSTYEIDLRRYLKIKRSPFVYATRLQAGIYEGDKLSSEEFRVGGTDSLRGYDEYYYRGTRMLIFNHELRFPISGGLTGVMFTDFADAWAKNVPFDLKVGSGFGIRYTLPGLGPIRLDYGYNWDKRQGQMYFSFGQMF